MYGLTLYTAATVEPLDINDVKRHLGVALDSGYHDSSINAYMIAARDWAQRYLNRQLCTAVWDYQIDRFPCYGEPIYIPRAPLRSITSITYLDYAGASQTWSSSLYRAVTSKEPGEVTEAYGQIYPETYPVSGAVTIRFSAGYGVASAVPEPIKQAMKLKITELFKLASGEDARNYEERATSLLSLYKVGDEFQEYASA